MAHVYKRHEGMGKRKMHGNEAGKRYEARGAEMRPEGSYVVSEDHSAHAGVPMEVKYHNLDMANSNYLSERHDDTVKGIDARLGHDAGMLKGKHSSDGRKC